MGATLLAAHTTLRRVINTHPALLVSEHRALERACAVLEQLCLLEQRRGRGPLAGGAGERDRMAPPRALVAPRA
jgi:ABC-type histidine transport system ATPase subunit